MNINKYLLENNRFIKNYLENNDAVADKILEIEILNQAKEIISLANKFLETNNGYKDFKEYLYKFSSKEENIKHLISEIGRDETLFEFIISEIISFEKEHRLQYLCKSFLNKNIMNGKEKFIPGFLFRIQNISGSAIYRDYISLIYSDSAEFNKKTEFYFG